MTSISLQEFQRDPASVLERIVAGESFVLTDGSRMVAEVRPVDPQRSAPRPFGLAKGEFVVPAEFDLPLPEEILAAFEGR
ncbi:type II toxin-antitoxin system Phd/YefM family antitoxin [Anatilimnocola floriformis]|uniref:type II toxin-antitoxin system Phd/YefM family antitoxin n=1 Tax=Anatilimnocola floriformis TaxID=2948575 RepID=UPI0020C4675B|nr:hypothetical protein [Anatilimnocola floriformis]